jgi:hypothetical protein
MSFQVFMDGDLEPLSNGLYATLTADLNTALRTTGYNRLSLYKNKKATTPALDSNGNPIISRLLTGTSYTAAHTDIDGNQVGGCFVVTFDDGSSFSNPDNSSTTYWFLVDGVEPVEVKQFI